MAGSDEILTIPRKALEVNLDRTIFGSFAEIGGGQEVARNFFQAGGASGTIAKTISAYDKQYSDAIYCKEKSSKRYVSRERLELMLDAEFSELVNLLGEIRSAGVRFFSLADTVSTLNFKKDNISHGWMGVKFQLNEGAAPNQVIIHVRLFENDSLLQQNTLGILGVNLLYACYYFWDRPNSFLQSLLDNLSTDRLAITMIHMSGAELSYVDNRLLGVQLVKNGMTNAIMFDRHGNVQEPDDMLYKKNVLVFRGSFRPLTYVSIDMLKSSYSLFKNDEDYDKHNTLPLCEITLNNLLSEGDFDEHDFLDRVDLLNEMGQNVMVSNFREFYKLVDYMTQFRIIKMRVVIGIDTFKKVMLSKYYSDLKGGIIEAIGKLFPEKVKMYIYPALEKNTGQLITISSLHFSADTEFLFRHLVENRKILDIKNMNPRFLKIDSHEVLEKIRAGNPQWEDEVPSFIAQRIKERKLFGYKKQTD
ncbi:MAG: nicotinate-nucleotide adenylyltransferase [Bacteroidetes bacterium HGW-Bacteroidetes-1]|jgi:hypothetical protein|nr:MAG: nicotinate-nucleotide adenylyltransferase [Bacteroidetes bacterium HGW-Bacteroidetes-1]